MCTKTRNLFWSNLQLHSSKETQEDGNHKGMNSNTNTKPAVPANLLSFKRATTPAASAGEGNPVDGDCGRSDALYALMLEEPVGVAGREEFDDPSSEEGNQDCVGITADVMIP